MIDDLKAAAKQALDALRSHWAFHQHKHYLKKMGWTEEAYQRQTDPLVNHRADRVGYFYHGYSRVHVFETVIGRPFIDYKDWIMAYNLMNQWCKDNCQGRWREDIHRVVRQTGLKQVGDSMEYIEEPEWFINDVGGGDVLVYAFELDQDYMMFSLKWS